MKYLVKTEAEINGMATIFQGGALELPSLGGKSMADIYGHNKVYNQDYFYAVSDLANNLINNPEHVDFGKYFVSADPADVTAHLTAELGNLVDYDPTWRLES